MALVYKDRVKQTVDAPATTSPFDFDSNGATPTGYQSFVDALADADTCIYAAEDASGNWETGLGTWAEANKTLTRTTILASSNSGSAETFTGTVTVFISADASRMQSAYEAHSAIAPGGRLTLSTGAPVADVTASTNIYYCPYVHDRITLWTGDYWKTIQFTEYTLALGTVTSGKPYDVFAYLNSGALALEKLIWTDDSTRATAVTLQDGRYCKSGDKTRLYLGSFYTTSSSETADSDGTRNLFNAYNAVPKSWYKALSGSHSYTTSTWRAYNNDSTQFAGIMNGLHAIPTFSFMRCVVDASGAQFGIGLNTTSNFTAFVYAYVVYSEWIMMGDRITLAANRYNKLQMVENGVSGADYTDGAIQGFAYV